MDRLPRKAIVVLLLMAGTGLLGSSVNEKSAKVDSLITGEAKAQNFNGTIAVQRNNEIIYFESFGKANFQFDVPNRNDTKYRIASITKLFTAVLVMEFVERGKLDLHKPIKTYLPSYAGEGAAEVTIRQLLTATSGIESSEKHGDLYHERLTTDDILKRYCSGKLEAEPGTKWKYNNADYVILGKVIEAITQVPFEQALREQILNPAGMNSSGMCNSRTIVPGLAFTYQANRHSKTIENDPLYYVENYYAAGAMYSTAGDLLKFSDALYGFHLLSEKSVREILTPDLAAYGYGLWIYDKEIDRQKIRVAERQGSIEGTTTRFLRLLDKGVTIILLSNCWTPAMNMDKLQFSIMKSVLREMETSSGN